MSYFREERLDLETVYDQRMAAHIPLLTETDDRFYVGPSSIPAAGQGLFARVELKEGDRLEVVGVLVPANSNADRCTQYADAYKFRAGDHLLIPIGWGAMINHHADANLEKIVEDGVVCLRAVRRIAQGEELFFSYSLYARERFGLP